MKQIRKISNMIAEELQNALDEQGITLDEDAFEERVSEIVSSIDEAVNEEAITEDDKFYFAASECSIGGVTVKEGEYVELEDTDEGTKATIFDEDGNIRESDIEVEDDDEFEDSLEELEESAEGDEDDDDIEEGDDLSKTDFKKQQKNVAKGKSKTGKRKIRGALLAKLKKNLAKARKRAHTGKANKNRMRTIKKRTNKGFYKKANAGSTSGTVTEAFDIHSDDITFTVEAGDVIVMEDNMISVIREGRTVISGIEVSEGFFDRCFEAAVLEAKGEDEEGAEECGTKKANEGEDPECKDPEGKEGEEKTDEAVLTFKANKGYVLVREGSELPMGNRVRARATLVSEGYNVTSAQLDEASKGQMVTL
jgi:hypothetical protein